MTEPYAAPTAPRPLPRWPGWLMMLPAVLLLLGQLVIPSIRVLIGSFFDGSFRGDRAFVGLANYERLASLQPTTFGTPVLLGGLLFVVALIIATGLGALGGRATGWIAVVIRIVLGIVLVCYSPTAMAMLSVLEGGLAEPPWSYLGLLMIYLPLVAAGSAVIALAVFANESVTVLRTGLVLAGFGLFASLAWALQLLDPSVVLGPRAFGRLPALATWEFGFQRADVGTAYALNTIMLVLLGLLGLAATLLVLAGRTRIDLPESTRRSETQMISVPAVVAVVLAGLGLILVLIMHRVWIGGLFALDSEVISAIGGPGELARVIINSWLPSLIATIGQVVVAALAGAGIGLFRPLGVRSRLLLLFFAPWMFTGVVPLMIINFTDLRTLGITDLWLSLLPRIWVVGPAILVFTLLFEGVRRSREHTGRIAVRPVLGVTGLIAVVLLVVQSQAAGWNYVIAISRELQTANTMLMRVLQRNMMEAEQVPTWLVFPLPLVIVLGAAAAVSLVLIGRVRISTGGHDPG